MCEIPNNVIQINAFATLFDGFSIGSTPPASTPSRWDARSRLFVRRKPPRRRPT